MVVEFFGTVRLRAGVASIAIEAQTLGEALARLSRELPALSGTVLVSDRVHRAFRASLNGEQFVTEPATVLESGDHLLILAADAGG